MKKLTIFLFLLIVLASCENTNEKTSKIEFYKNNQDQFTFLVFDKTCIDTFLLTFTPLKFDNNRIKDSVLKDLTILHFESKVNDSIEKTMINYSSNTKQPDTGSYELARKVIYATYKNNDRALFPGCLSYLFFYNCLPKEFKYKWHQSTSGHFDFNVTFFDLLRKHSNEFDQFLYGEIGYWDDKLKPVFGEYITNEITPETAKAIKKTIENNKIFEDIRFRNDRDNFIHFLDKTIKGQWRLIMIDWN